MNYSTIYFADEAIFTNELELRDLTETTVSFEGGETRGATDYRTNEKLVLDENAYDNAPSFERGH